METSNAHYHQNNHTKRNKNKYEDNNKNNEKPTKIHRNIEFQPPK